MKNNQEQAIVQKEALINEYKGAVFEYMVAEQLARSYQQMELFLGNFSHLQKERLLQYQRFIQLHDKELLLAMPQFALKMAKELKTYLPKKSLGIHLVGAHHEKKMYGETDILVRGEKQRVFPISLKLCRYKSYVNTKSAGIKSFLSRYFSGVLADGLQEKLNKLADRLHVDLANEFYHYFGLKPVNGFEKQWFDQKLPVLPGELNQVHHQELLVLYHQLAKEIYHSFLFLLQDNPAHFKRSLMPLCGFSKENMIQANCFHETKNKIRYSHSKIKIMQLTEDSTKAMKISPIKDGLSSFEILLDDLALQIRVKPMNKFTVPSYKINCSIKH